MSRVKDYIKHPEEYELVDGEIVLRNKGRKMPRKPCLSDDEWDEYSFLAKKPEFELTHRERQRFQKLEARLNKHYGVSGKDECDNV